MASNTHSFAEIHPLELQEIKKRRIHAELPEGDPEHDSIALCLSGGGIRSATFNLGILQAMERQGQLKYVDYLSTVSGGGYIGSSLTWFMSAFKNPRFPFGTRRQHHNADEGRVLAWLRGHGNYLTPGEGLNLWALIGAVLTGTLINLAVLVPLFLSLIYFLSQDYFNFIPLFISLDGAPQYLKDSGFTRLITIGLILFGLFLLVAFVYSIGTSISKLRTSTYQRSVRKIGGVLLVCSVGLIIIGSIPFVHYAMQLYAADWIRSLMSVISLSGIASVLAALKGKEGGNESKGLRAFALGVGLSLLIYGLFLWFYHVMVSYESLPVWLYVALGFSLILAVFANIQELDQYLDSMQKKVR